MNTETAPQLTTSRMKGESGVAYAAFLAFAQMGAERGLTAVGQQLKKSTTLMARWASRWLWNERALIWDSEQLDIQREATAKAALAQATVREARRTELRERAWKLQDAFLDKISAMLQLPITKKKVSADGKTTIIMPGPWNFGTTARMAQIFTQLGMFATGMSNKIGDTDDSDESDAPTMSGKFSIPTELPKLVIEVVDRTNEIAPKPPPTPSQQPAVGTQTASTNGNGAKQSTAKPNVIFKRS